MIDIVKQHPYLGKIAGAIKGRLNSAMVGAGPLPGFIDPRTGSVFFDDFFTGNVTTTGPGWLSVGGGTGGGAGVGLSGTDAFGEIRTTATGNGGASRGVLYNGVSQVDLSNGKTYCEWRVKISSLSDVSNPFECWVGLHDNSGIGDATDGIGFGYDETNHGDFWVPYVVGGGTVTDLVLDGGGGRETAAVTADTWTRLGFACESDASSVEFFVNGVSKGTISTNIPVGGETTGLLIKIEKTTGASQRFWRADYAYLAQVFDTAR